MRRLALLFALAAGCATAAQAVTIEKVSVKNGTVDVPVEVARPAGPGPFPPLLYVHARRGF
ncbi:MAG TPA: hypothetical protein VLC47_02695, partial [Burkholderiales bacterium]|nr:hypothetical protein [Burkholderiales bacterium]